MARPTDSANILSYESSGINPPHRPWYVIAAGVLACVPAVAVLFVVVLSIRVIFGGASGEFPAMIAFLLLPLVITLPFVIFSYRAIVRRSHPDAATLWQLATIPAVLVTIAMVINLISTGVPASVHALTKSLCWTGTCVAIWFVVLVFRKWSKTLGSYHRQQQSMRGLDSD